MEERGSGGWTSGRKRWRAFVVLIGGCCAALIGINLVYVLFFIIGKLSVRMQLAERAIEQQLGGIALFERSIGSLNGARAK